MAVQQSRYLGVQPFKTSDKHLFFGRDEDIENLHDTILLEKLIVLFGKSGYGKSSLLNAGIVPRLTAAEQQPSERFRPIEVRFTSFAVGQSVSPMDTMQFLLKDLPFTEGGVFLKKTEFANTLWGQFKQRQGVGNGQFVLIFDQFEEFFSYPPEQQDVFRRQLSELLYTDIPQAARAKMGEFSEAERRYLATPMHIKAVFAIREDRMSFLDSMKDTLPAILHKRYKLAPLSIEQAKQAITQPAVMAGDFLSQKFEYTEGGLSAIVKALTTTTMRGKETTKTGIEAFQLQIVCEYIESLVKEGKVQDLDGNGLPDITEAELPHMGQLYSEYYYRKLHELDPSLKTAAQIALEEGLLTEEPSTGECKRMSVDSRALIGQFRYAGLTDAVLLALEKSYLIRREMNTVGGFSFEISHDTLVASVQKAKKDRLLIEKQKEELLLKEKINIDKRRKLRRYKKITLLVLIAFLTVIVIRNWEFIYFGGLVILNGTNQPVITNKSKLNSINEILEEQFNAEARLIQFNSDNAAFYNSAWVSGQVFTIFEEKTSNINYDSLIVPFLKMQMNDDSCSWTESQAKTYGFQDLRSTAWAVGAINRRNLSHEFNCDISDLLIKNQLSTGAWSVIDIHKTLTANIDMTKYAATYPTCHALLGLKYGKLKNKNQTAIEQSIKNGISWLKESRKSILWKDYPYNTDEGTIFSKSLTGLAIHTLCSLGYPDEEINRTYLNALDMSETEFPFDFAERTEVYYRKRTADKAIFYDATRHLVFPWQIIATVDAYKDGSLNQKIKASRWLSTVVDKLDISELAKRQIFIKSEFAIAFRYLEENKIKL